MSSKPIIVGVTSLANAGKDTFASRLVSEYSFTQLNLSDVLRDELIKQGKEPTKDNMSILGSELRKQYGRDIVIRMFMDKASLYGKVIITGIRSPEEVDYLRQNSDYFVLVKLTAPLDLRFKRRKSLDPQTIEGFTFRDERDIKNMGLDKVIESADYEISNTGSLDELYAEIDGFMAYAVASKMLPEICLR